jgi:hypothetical protein
MQIVDAGDGLTPKRQPAKADVTVPVVAAATDSTNSSVA